MLLNIIGVACNLRTLFNITINVQQVLLVYYSDKRVPALHSIDVIKLQTTDYSICITSERSEKGQIHHFRARLFYVRKRYVYEFECANFPCSLVKF